MRTWTGASRQCDARPDVRVSSNYYQDDDSNCKDLETAQGTAPAACGFGFLAFVFFAVAGSKWFTHNFLVAFGSLLSLIQSTRQLCFVAPTNMSTVAHALGILNSGTRRCRACRVRCFGRQVFHGHRHLPVSRRDLLADVRRECEQRLLLGPNARGNDLSWPTICRWNHRT
jgi:hypothetical protein